MKKILAIFLAVLLLLCGCSSKKDSNSKAIARMNLAGRYYLYVSNNKLHCLDAKTGKTNSIETGTDVLSVESALVSELNGHVLLSLVTDMDDEGNNATAMFLWDGTSPDATFIDSDASLARVDEKMHSVVYAKGQALYRYQISDGTEKLFDYYRHVAVSEDLSRILVTAPPVPKPEDFTSGNSLTVNEWNLLYQEAGKEAELIAQISINACYVATADLRVVCYTKGPSLSALFEPHPVYMWTAKDGEQQLPFEATQMVVHSENEIYYLGNDTSLYYYDGKESHLLSTDAKPHIHKLSEDISCVNQPNAKGMLVLHKGKAVPVSGYLCPQRGIYGGISVDGKTAYFHNSEQDVWYQVQVQKDGELDVSRWVETSYYSARNDRFENDLFVYEMDDVLYCNGQTVTKNVDNYYDIWPSGKLCYTEDGILYRWEAGKSTKVADVGNADDIFGFESNVVMLKSDALYFISNSEKTLIDESLQSITPVETWGTPCTGNVYIGGVKTGWWYENSTYDKFTS